MSYKPFALILLVSLAMPIHGARGRKLVRRSKQKVERRDFLAMERSRSRSRHRSLSRERELRLERDRERTAAMGKCINFGGILITVASKLAEVILKLVIK